MIRLVLASLSLALAAPAFAAPKVAIFPFDIRDVEIEGDLMAKPKDYDLARMKLVAEELKTLMEKSGAYEVVDLAPFAADVEKASPFSTCNGCEAELGKKVGADLAVTGYVDKLSDSLISLQLYARDTATGEVKKTMAAEIRGNTDELWLHGIRWLWKNRFNPQPAAASQPAAAQPAASAPATSEAEKK
jgi:Protein of unknown function (DUF2380)